MVFLVDRQSKAHGDIGGTGKSNLLFSEPALAPNARAVAQHSSSRQALRWAPEGQPRRSSKYLRSVLYILTTLFYSSALSHPPQLITERKQKDENIKASRQCWSRENSAYFESTNTVSRKKVPIHLLSRQARGCQSMRCTAHDRWIKRRKKRLDWCGWKNKK